MLKNNLITKLTLATLTFLAPLSAKDIAYITDYMKALAYPLDVETNTLGASIPVGSMPAAVVISPDNKKALVVNNGGDTVTVIDTATNKTSKTISVGRSPEGIAISPDGAKAYVLSQSSHNMHIIDLSTLELVGQPIELGENTLPRQIAITPDGKTGYITQYGNDVLRKVDLATLSMKEIPLPKGSGAEGIVIDSTGSFALILYGYSGHMVKLDLKTDALVADVKIGETAMAPQRLVISPDNTMAYATLSTQQTIVPVDLKTFTAQPGIKIEQESPSNLAMTSNGSRIYVTVSLGGVIVPITTSDKKTHDPIKGAEGPRGIAIKKQSS